MDPSVIGEIRNNGGIVKVMDEVGVIELRAATLLRNVIPTDRTAKDQTTLLFRCPEISDGVELLCEDGGEFLFI
ncbi:MAG: hypothetical protein R3212_02705 [Xanthomonadales bacterium]|nr:hypothetical protein [Xanthomonadales bacterium]